MEFRVGFLQVGDDQFRVVLERTEVPAAEQVLHVPKVRTAADQLDRATAAERVRRDRDRQVSTPRPPPVGSLDTGRRALAAVACPRR